MAICSKKHIYPKSSLASLIRNPTNLKLLQNIWHKIQECISKFKIKLTPLHLLILKQSSMNHIVEDLQQMLQGMTLAITKISNIFSSTYGKTIKTPNIINSPLQFWQTMVSFTGVGPIKLWIVSSNVFNEHFLHSFTTSRRLFPFSRQIYCDARLYDLHAWISNLQGGTT